MDRKTDQIEKRRHLGLWKFDQTIQVIRALGSESLLNNGPVRTIARLRKKEAKEKKMDGDRNL